MPFPYHVVPYGYKQRLRELVAPVEAYQLQLAVGDCDMQPLLPIQKVQAIHKQYMHRRNLWPPLVLSKFPYQCANPKERDSNVVANIREIMFFPDIREADLDDPLFQNIYIEAHRITLTLKHPQGLSFFEKLSKKFYGKVTKLSLTYANGFEVTEPCVRGIFPLFPHLEEAVFGYNWAYPGWLTDLLESKKSGMKKICVNGAFNDMFSFTTDQFVQFLSNQHEDFMITFRCCLIKPDDVSAEILALFDHPTIKAFADVKSEKKRPTVWLKFPKEQRQTYNEALDELQDRALEEDFLFAYQP